MGEGEVLTYRHHRADVEGGVDSGGDVLEVGVFEDTGILFIAK